MILLDTHIVVWLLLEPDRLSRHAKEAIENSRSIAGGGVAVSNISLLEMTLMQRKRRLQLNVPFSAWLHYVEAVFLVLPIRSESCMHLLSFPDVFPKDPFDALIAGSALAEGIPLVTADAAIRRSRVVETIW